MRLEERNEVQRSTIRQNETFGYKFFFIYLNSSSKSRNDYKALHCSIKKADARASWCDDSLPKSQKNHLDFHLISVPMITKKYNKISSCHTPHIVSAHFIFNLPKAIKITGINALINTLE
jgi:hypothetical protein